MRRFETDSDFPDFEPMRGTRVRNPAKRDNRKRNTLRAHRGGR
jgi:hypothetical protein